MAGLRYLQPLTATGGQSPYLWSATGLPAGLTLTGDGILAGTPTATGTTAVGVQVTDGAGTSLTRTLSLAVPDSLPTPCLSGPCSIVTPDGSTVALAATSVVSIARDATTGAVNQIVINTAPPAVNQILAVEPTPGAPSGLVARVDAVTVNGDGTTTLAVTPGTPADAYASGTVKAVDSAALAATTLTPATTAGTTPSVTAGPLFARNLTTTGMSPSVTASAAMPAPSPLKCDNGVTSDLHGLTVDPALSSEVTAIWKHPLFSVGGFYPGTGGLSVFQFGTDGTITVNLGVTVSGTSTCTLTLPKVKTIVPAGALGAVITTVTPTLTLKVTGKVDLRTSVTLACTTEYLWENGAEIMQGAYCSAKHQPLQLSADSGADVTLTGALDARVTLDEIAGITGNITAAAHAGYHPAGRPVAQIDAKTTYTIGACLACFWKGSPAHVTMVDKVLFDKVLYTSDTAPDPTPAPAPTPLAVTTTTLPDAVVAQPYTSTLVATGGTAPFTWSVASGSLPPGLSLSTAGSLSGTPTTPGTVDFTVTVHDSTGATATAPLTLVVGGPGATPPDTTAPGPVTALHATTVTATSVGLAWTNPTDADFTGVMIRRAVGSTAPATSTDGVLVNDMAKPATSFSDTNLSSGAQYSYAVFARDGVPNYATAAITTATTTPPSTTGVAVGDIVFEGQLPGETGGTHLLKLSGVPPNSTITPLTTSVNDSFDYGPDVSSDGSEIVFESDRANRNPDSRAESNAIFVVNSDGSGLRAIDVPPREQPTADGFRWWTDGEPRWSPDKTKVAFVRSSGSWIGTDSNGHSGPNGPSDIYVTNADGSNLVPVTTDGKAGGPIWSPDSRRLAFSESNGFNISDVDGTNVHLISSSLNSLMGSITDWSPDGKSIYGTYAFNALEGGIGAFVSADGFATTEHLDATLLTDAGDSVGQWDGGPRVSGDGSHVVFVRKLESRRCPANDGCFQFWTINTSDNSQSQVSSFGGATNTSLGAPSLVKESWPTSTAKNLVALGDSVAAGEGINFGFSWTGSTWTKLGPDNPTWTDTTPASGTNYQYCHQTDLAYSRLFLADNYNVYNMACTGATAMGDGSFSAGGILDREVLDGGVSPLAQLGGNCVGCDSPNAVFDAHNADVVTLTVGANDVHFSDWMKNCYNPNILDGCDTQANTDSFDSELALARANLRLVLAELNRRAGLAGKNLRVLVTNYYDPFSAENTGCIDYANGTNTLIDGGELAWLENGLTSLGSNIASEVIYAQANAPHLDVRFVDLSNVMAGHQLCTVDPWVYGPSIDFPLINGSIVPGNNPAPFHPTPAGQRAIYRAVKVALAN